MRSYRLLTVVFVCLVAGSLQVADARTRLKNICRVKGQEENTLQGLGLVVGLEGTGDGSSSKATIISLAKTLELMGSPKLDPKTIEASNVALVTVQATVPAAGGRRGDTIDCRVQSIGGAKSLAGGTLLLTPLLGPRTDSNRVYAKAAGTVHVEDPLAPNSASISGGCQRAEDFRNAFVLDNKITLVLDRHKADFQVAADIAELINSQLNFQQDSRSRESTLAHAIDQVNIEITIPQAYRADPVAFVSQIISLPILTPQIEARVVVDRAAETIVVSGDVEIGATVINHKNLSIDTTGEKGTRFVPLDSNSTKTSQAKLSALVETLDALQVDTVDIIDIVISLHRSGKLHGKLVVSGRSID